VSAVRYLFDQDFNGRIVRGVRRRTSKIDTITAQEAGLADASDSAVLEWAASDGRVVISHDHKTMRAYAEERLKQGSQMAGVILVSQSDPLGEVIDDLVLVGEITTAEEWEGKIIFLPL
jgi:predicted nuclease of predicted toxin-antitoxin system